MGKSLIIGFLALLVVVGVASAAEWKPSWAPDPIPLVPGQVYKTGSPLSGDGLFGLFGGILGVSRGGGAEMWTGGEFAPVPEGYQAPASAPRTVTINGMQMKAFTLAEAKAAQDAVDWSQVENKQRATVPLCGDGQRLYVTIVPDAEIGARNVYSCRE